ncbi:MAG: hypothetical protein QGG42_04560 [Phycisphaerae bacterium]|jgi:hypothetical protein|nr:hypothetical protein [Phycisphaerae bacterium]
MKTLGISVVVCAMLSLPVTNLPAAETGTANFVSYFNSDSAWLDKRAPADLSEASVKAILKDPVFRNRLARRRLIAKLGADKLAGFAKSDKSNAAFLAWIIRSTDVMDLYLLGATPVGIAQRNADNWKPPAKSLDIWKSIHSADRESRKGLYLKLAIAIALSPPGTGNRGVGQAEKPATPLDRFNHFKTAHKNKELLAGFDKLTVWEYRQIVSSNASDADLAWGREMINTWRPDLRAGGKVVLSTGRVWRRGSPYGYKNGFRSVMEGGGKCGPRSSWAVFICQAFGIPATGVRQPGHVCVTWRSPSGQWMLGYGRGWNASKAMGMSGREFLAATEARSHTTEFSQVERLRWLASALASKDRAAAVMAIAKKISRAQEPDKINLNGKFEPSKGLPIKPKGPKFTPETPIKVAPGVIHVEAEAFAKMGGKISYGGLQTPGVCVHNCYTGGKQIHFQSHMQTAWVEYNVDAPKAGKYALQLRLAAANRDQVMDIGDGKKTHARINIPNTYGLWSTTPPVYLDLKKGPQTIRISTPFQRGVSVRWLELKSK